jgi:hypothetical protein
LEIEKRGRLREKVGEFKRERKREKEGELKIEKIDCVSSPLV